MRASRASTIAGLLLMTVLVVALIAPRAAAQPAGPVLRYAPPADTYRAAAASGVDDYTFANFSASVTVYQFRPFNGDIRQAFQATLLRDWIVVAHQEENVAGQPTFAPFNVPGAQYAVIANFGENVAGLLRAHFRMLIVAGGQAAIFDASAGTMQSWQQAAGPLNAMIGTLRVETARALAPLSVADGRAAAGLYRGMKPKYTATTVNITGSPTWVNALHYYLFSAAGRVYCAYDQLDVPQGRIELFDFDAAQRRDAANSGRYTVDRGKLIIQVGGDAPIVTDVPQNGRVRINTILYERQ